MVTFLNEDEISELEDIPLLSEFEGASPQSDIPSEPELRGEKRLFGRAATSFGALKAARFVAGFTPVSPITEFVAETGEALIDEKPILEALKAGGKAAGTDLALRVALGGLPAGAGKVLSKKTADLIDVGLIPKAIGKASFGPAFSKRFRQEIIDEVVERPDLLTKSSKTFDDLGSELFEAVDNKLKNTGKLIGEAKKKAGLTNLKINVDDVSDSAIASRANIAKRDIGNDAINVVTEELDDLVKNPKIENAFDKLKEIDNSKEFQRIYTKNLNPNEVLSEGERQALSLRGELNEKIFSVTDELFQNENLRELKSDYSFIKQFQKNPLFKSSFRTKDSATKKLITITREGNRDAFRTLKELDNIIPEIKNITDDVIKNSIDDEIDLIRSLKGGLTPAIVEFAAGTVPKALLKRGTLSKGSVGKPLVTGLTRRAAIELQREE